MQRYISTERLGVNATEHLIVKEIGWIFREQPIVDMGIDAHIESVKDGNPSGKLIGVQIKTGPSHFKDKGDLLVYYGNRIHLDYWLNHSLPVILVAHLPDTNETYWTQVNTTNAQKTIKHWKIEIPKIQSLDSSAIELLEEITEGTEEEKKQRQLYFGKGLMKLVSQGGRLFVTTQEWHNKSLGRSPFTVIYQNDNLEERTEKEWFIWYTGYSLEGLIQHYFPWANIGIDEEFYEENFSETFYDVYTDMHIRNHNIYPYEVLAGEVSNYRLELKLNDLGKSFLKIADYLES
jgi:hypothetical protein